MGKRYITIGAFFIILVACFFIFFDNPSNKELYYECVDKLSRVNSYDNIEDNRELNIDVDNSYFNNQYNYVVTFTSNTVLNNFKALVMSEEVRQDTYYPSFGVFDNQNINLVNDSMDEGETRGVNLVVSSREIVNRFKVYVSYNGYEYYYLVDVGE